MPRNGTYRELERRAVAFREATGKELAGIWISQERFNLLPEAIRAERSGSMGYRGPGVVLCHISGVPVRVIEIVDAAGR